MTTCRSSNTQKNTVKCKSATYRLYENSEHQPICVIRQCEFEKEHQHPENVNDYESGLLDISEMKELTLEDGDKYITSMNKIRRSFVDIDGISSRIQRIREDITIYLTLLKTLSVTTTNKRLREIFDMNNNLSSITSRIDSLEGKTEPETDPETDPKTQTGSQNNDMSRSRSRSPVTNPEAVPPPK